MATDRGRREPSTVGKDDPSPVVVPEPVPEGLRRGLLWLLAIACLLLAPWVIFLAIELPGHYVAANWDVAWVGFDVALLAGLLVTAWAAWRRRQLVIVTSIVTGTLLLCDAWFDVTTAHAPHDRAVSVITALLVEIPFAVLLFVTALRLVALTTRTVRASLDGDGRPVPLWRVPLLLSDTASEHAARPNAPG